MLKTSVCHCCLHLVCCSDWRLNMMILTSQAYQSGLKQVRVGYVGCVCGGGGGGENEMECVGWVIASSPGPF